MSEKVLIIDDHISNIRIIAEMLKDKYEVFAANNGIKGVAVAKESKPDIILLDIMMPEMDGYRACETLKSDIETQDVPIIFISAKNEMDDIIKGFSIGGQDYITKPFRPEELFARIKTHLELKRSREMLKKYIKELEEKNRELDVMAKTDYLTGLANRRYMVSKLEEEIIKPGLEYGDSSLLMCDIDFFKKINDTYGHEAGDMVIKKVADIVKKHLSEGDIASRWGGEEILILLSGKSLKISGEIAESIRMEIERMKTIDELSVTVSIGISKLNREEGIVDNINNADEALYIGKSKGRNIVVIR